MTTINPPIGNSPVHRTGDTAAVQPGVAPGGTGASTKPPPADLPARLSNLAGGLAAAPTIPKPSEEALDFLYGGRLDSALISEIAALLTAKTSNEQVSAAGRRTELQNKGVSEATKQQLEKVKEHFEALRKSEGWGLFAKIFSWVAAIVTTVVAVVVTGGAAAVLAGTALALMAAQELGLTEKFMDMLGIPKEAQGWVMMGLSLALSVVSVGAAVKAFVKKAGQVVSKVVDDAAAKASQAVGGKMKSAANIASGGTQVVAGTAQVGAAITGYKSNVAAVAVKQSEADMARLQKALEEGMTQLSEAVENMQATINEAIMAMLNAHDGNMNTLRAI